MANWRTPSESSHGFVDTLSHSVARAEEKCPLCIPDLRQSPVLLIASDYSGSHAASAVEVYSFLALGFDHSFKEWEFERRRLRLRYRLGTRRLAFKGMSDLRKRSAIQAFLHAASHLHGLCLTVMVEKSFGSFFKPDQSTTQVPPFKNTERVGRLVHLASLLIAGLGRAGQDVLWLSDEDEIAANEAHLRALVTLLSQVASNYIDFNMRHLRVGTTACDSGDRQVEDLVAIPDLVAGMLSEVATKWLAAGWTFGSSITVPTPQTTSAKSHILLDWLSRNGEERLGRLVFAVRADRNGLYVNQIEARGWR